MNPKKEIRETVIENIQADTKKMSSTVARFKIVSAKDLEKAVEFLGQIKTRQKRLESLRIEYTKPLNDQVKKINGDFKAWSKPYDDMEKVVKGLVSEFRAEEERKRREQEAKLLKEAQAKALKEAKKNGTSEKKALQNVVAPVIEEQPSIMQSANSQIKVRKVLKYRVLDEKKIPREYFMLNDSAVKNAMRNGIVQIPGIEMYEEEVLASYGV